jgi:hypothetical protein
VCGLYQSQAVTVKTATTSAALLFCGESSAEKPLERGRGGGFGRRVYSRSYERAFIEEMKEFEAGPDRVTRRRW